VYFASRAFTGEEIRYPMIDKEMLLIVCSCLKFHSWIYGLQNVQVQGNNRPLETTEEANSFDFISLTKIVAQGYEISFLREIY
jgi:RNase H-like domain found in reverse transcriptase